MAERYPYMRFVVEAAQPIAVGIGIVILFGGTISACHQGGAGGFLSFLISILVALAAYVALMVQFEALRLLLDVESTTRQILAQTAGAPPTPLAG